ncbi:MAG: hypothetical protein U0R51_14715 [Solirubrobacterales bacterium]
MTITFGSIRSTFQQVGTAGVELDRLRIAVAGRAAHQRVGDEDGLAVEADLAEELIQKTAGPADERKAALVLRPWRLAENTDRRRRCPPRTRPSSASGRAGQRVQSEASR